MNRSLNMFALAACIALLCGCVGLPLGQNLKKSKSADEDGRIVTKLYVIDVDELYFGPRTNILQFTVENTSGKDLTLNLHVDKVAGKNIKDIQSGFTDYWVCFFPAGMTKHISVEVNHDEMGLHEGNLAITAGDNQEWVTANVPLIVETTMRSFTANVVGKVTDTEGTPLKDILIECNGVETLTDSNGEYDIEDLPYFSSFTVTATSDKYISQKSDIFNYRIDEFVVDFVLEEAKCKLSFNVEEVDFGTGSISQADINTPEIAYVNISVSDDMAVNYSFSIINPDFGVFPGLIYSPTSANTSHFSTLRIEFWRAVSKVGSYTLTAEIKTDIAGTYHFPVKVNNTP